MPKEGDAACNEAATNAIKLAAKKKGKIRGLYILIHGREPESETELNRFRNRLNPSRGATGADLLGECIKHLPELHYMPVAKFFGIETDAEDQKQKTGQ